MKRPTALFSAALALTLPAAAQKAGDKVTPEALSKLEWIQGEAPAEWEAGKLYVLECWATWCGPCIAAIPHVDELYDKYQEKGLRVIGVNVWEDGKDKVADFVKKKGDGMSYPVAYTGKGGAFETEWLKPAEVSGIPHAFVVMDGEVLFTTHPSRLNDETIEQLLSGPEGVKKVAADLREAGREREEIGKLSKAFAEAARSKDTEGMKSAMAGLEKIPSAKAVLPRLKLQLAMSTEDWDGITAVLEESKSEPSYIMMLSMVTQRVSSEESKATPELRRKVADALAEAIDAPNSHPLLPTQLARLQWVLGDKDAAIASAEKQVEVLKSPDAGRHRIPVEPSEKLVAAMKEGNLPSEKEFFSWMSAARAAAAPAAPAVPKTE
ncbi:MAG: TlpA family protein disulfide reductase [Akkermansiaceae bacterium]|nr:TlpA family protein disulfide reductase [Akkermansiaceae bacterium]